MDKLSKATKAETLGERRKRDRRKRESGTRLCWGCLLATSRRSAPLHERDSNLSPSPSAQRLVAEGNLYFSKKTAIPSAIARPGVTASANQKIALPPPLRFVLLSTAAARLPRPPLIVKIIGYATDFCINTRIESSSSWDLRRISKD